MILMRRQYYINRVLWYPIPYPANLREYHYGPPVADGVGNGKGSGSGKGKSDYGGDGDGWGYSLKYNEKCDLSKAMKESLIKKQGVKQ